MQQKGIHWFPGHMQKALRQIEERLKIIDVVIELLDARAPLSCRNDYLYNMTSSKKRLIILTKLLFILVSPFQQIFSYSCSFK